MRIYNRNGKRPFRACDATCASGFRTDRRYGLIYPPVRITPENRVVGWEAGSVECAFCAYCGKDAAPAKVGAR